MLTLISSLGWTTRDRDALAILARRPNWDWQTCRAAAAAGALNRSAHLAGAPVAEHWEAALDAYAERARLAPPAPQADARAQRDWQERWRRYRLPHR